MRREPRLSEHAVQQARGRLARAREHVARIRVADREPLLRRDPTGVELSDRLVDRHAGLLVAGEDRALNRRGAAPTREQRRMHVQKQRALEETWRDVQAVRADDHTLDVLRQRRLLRLVHRDPEPRGRNFGGWWREPPTAAAGRVGTREQKRDLVARGEPLEHVGPERCRGGDADAH